jgi:cytochrome P450
MQPASDDASTTPLHAGDGGSACPYRSGDIDRFPLPRRHPFDPQPLYAELGRDAPVRKVVQWNGRPAWFVTRHADIRSLLMDRRTSADAAHPAYPAQNAALTLVRKEYQVFAQMDPPEHTAERRLLAGEFSVRRVEALRPKVQSIVDDVVGSLAAKPGAADLVQDFAMPLPCRVICTLLGVPEKDQRSIQTWAATITSHRTTREQAAQLTREFCDGYLTDLVRSKDAAPDDDLLSRLVVDHMRAGTITERKVVSLARLLLTAGHESTTGTLAVGMAALLYHPEQLELLRSDPSLIESAVEEILRYTDVTHSGRLRTAREDIEIGGVTIRAGEAIIMHQPTANREPGVFANPHRFDITRNPRQHLAFGMGIHGCIGQPLARLELQLGIATLVGKLPGLQPAEALENLRFNHGMAIYGLESLPVTW